jgi:hypothetical protein
MLKKSTSVMIRDTPYPIVIEMVYSLKGGPERLSCRKFGGLRLEKQWASPY